MFGSIASGSSTLGPVRRSEPRLAGRTIPPSSVKPFSGPSIQDSYIGTMKWIGWMSGTGRPGRERQKRCVWQAGRPGDGGPTSRSALKITGESRWSWRFSPTPGRSATTSIADARAGDPPARRRRAAAAAPSRSSRRRRSPRRACARLDAAVARPLDADAARARRTAAAARRAPVTTLRSGVRLDRAEVRGRRAVADAVLDAVLHEGDAVLRVPVVVRVERDAALARPPPTIATWIAIRLEVDVSRLTVPGPPAPRAARCARRRAARRPTTSRRRPRYAQRVEVRGCAAHPDHGVEAARAAEHPCRAASAAGGPPRAACGTVS